MKNTLLIFFLSAFVMLSGCKKEAPVIPDGAANWIGTYNASNNGSIQQIQINAAGNNALQVIIKINQFSYLYTASTLQNVIISGTNANAAVISEDEHIIETTDLGLYSFKGTISLSGNQVTMNAVATNLESGATSENSPMNFTFSGSRAQ